jgi:hypothetical protein
MDKNVQKLSFRDPPWKDWKLLYGNRNQPRPIVGLYIIPWATHYLKRLVAGFPPWRPGFDLGSGQVGFVVDRVVLGQVFSEYFGVPCQSSFLQLLHNHPHLSFEAGRIGQKWPQHKGLSPTPLAIKRNISLKSDTCSHWDFQTVPYHTKDETSCKEPM